MCAVFQLFPYYPDGDQTINYLVEMLAEYFPYYPDGDQTINYLVEM